LVDIEQPGLTGDAEFMVSVDHGFALNNPALVSARSNCIEAEPGRFKSRNRPTNPSLFFGFSGGILKFWHPQRGNCSSKPNVNPANGKQGTRTPTR
jgi:hypothetical protein